MSEDEGCLTENSLEPAEEQHLALSMYLPGLTYQETVVVVQVPLFPWAEKFSNPGIEPSRPEACWWGACQKL